MRNRLPLGREIAYDRAPDGIVGSRSEAAIVRTKYLFTFPVASGRTLGVDNDQTRLAVPTWVGGLKADEGICRRIRGA